MSISIVHCTPTHLSMIKYLWDTAQILKYWQPAQDCGQVIAGGIIRNKKVHYDTISNKYYIYLLTDAVNKSL